MNEDKWTLFLSNHVITHVQTEQEAEELKALLVDKGGVCAEEIKVYRGSDGYKEIDPKGKHHGLTGKLWRAMQNLGEELPIIKRFAQRIKEGCVGYAIPYDTEEQRKELVALIRQGPGRDIVYTTGSAYYEVTEL